MFELIIKQQPDGRCYTNDHKYYSKDLEELFEMVEQSIKLAKCEISYVIREIEEGQIEEDEE